jgi:hypothetical protein
MYDRLLDLMFSCPATKSLRKSILHTIPSLFFLSLSASELRIRILTVFQTVFLLRISLFTQRCALKNCGVGFYLLK